MKTKTTFFAILITLVIASCKKYSPTPINSGTTTYSSIQDFYNTNGVQKQIYTIDASIGGMFISPKGTKVTIPANAFVTESGGPISGIVTIEFKDIYSKSDMLLSDVPSMMYTGAPLKSAGEFFIKALSGTNPLILDSGKLITMEQPSMDGTIDTAMTAFAGIPDTTSTTGGITWASDPDMTVAYGISSYIYTMSAFSMPTFNGTWGNSDNGSYFSAFTQTLLTITPNDNPSDYYTDVFLVFSGVNTVLHIYQSGTNFLYYFAPIGQQCTIVAFGVKDGKLYSSFTPITISPSQTVNFTLTETTDTDFKTQLNALN